MMGRWSPAAGAVGVWLRRLQVMTEKELLQLFRDAILVLVILYGFTLDVYLAGSGLSLQLNRAPLVVHDADQSAASRELLSRFRPPYFQLDGAVTHADEGTRLLDRGEEMMVLHIPPQFQRRLLKGEPAAVQLQIDATNPVLGLLAAGYGAQIVGQFGQEAALARLRSAGHSLQTAPVIRDAHRVWFNPNENDAWFMSTEELITVVTLFAILLPAAAMAREKERGTVEQLLVSPLTPFQIMFPKVLAMTAVIVAGTALSVEVVLKLIFHVPTRGSLLLFFGMTTLYVFTNAGLGMFVATITRNLAQVGMVSILISIPMLFLSGTWTPPEAMPGWLRLGILISPLHYYGDATFGIFLKGAGPDLLWGELAGIVLLGAVLFAFGTWRLRRQFG
jgi:ABC-2 type transport system permease protein